MNKVLILAGLACFFMSACNNCSKKNEPTTIVAPNNTSTDEDSCKTIYPSEKDTITMVMVNGTSSLKIHKEERQAIYLKFDSEDYKKMQGKLYPADSMANVRFSQITLPDGRMDGPFGRDVTYDLSIKGYYILSIHESQMAGDPWGGDFKVTISLSN